MAGNGVGDSVLFEVLTVDASDVSVKMSVWSDEIDEGGILVLRTQRFNQQSHKYEPDEKLLEEADNAAKKAFGVGIEDIMENPHIVEGSTFEGYRNEDADNGYVYLTPPRTYTRFDKIDSTAAVRAIKAIDFPIETTPLEESRQHGLSKNNNAYAIAQFNTGIRVDVKGEEKTYRISQIKVVPDDDESDEVVLKTKYLDDFVKETYQDYDEGRISDPDRARKILKNADNTLDRNRSQLIERYKSVAGFDLESMIENGEGFTVTEIEVATVPANNTRFLCAVIEPNKTGAGGSSGGSRVNREDDGFDDPDDTLPF